MKDILKVFQTARFVNLRRKSHNNFFTDGQIYDEKVCCKVSIKSALFLRHNNVMCNHIRAGMWKIAAASCVQ